MDINQFKERCNQEFLAKNPCAERFTLNYFKHSLLTLIGYLIGFTGMLFFWQIVTWILNATAGEEAYRTNWEWLIIILFLYPVVAIVTCCFARRRKNVAMKKIIKSYEKSGVYVYYPVNYPFSILYLNEPYPFTEVNNEISALEMPTSPEPHMPVDRLAPPPVAPAPAQVTTYGQYGNSFVRSN